MLISTDILQSLSSRWRFHCTLFRTLLWTHAQYIDYFCVYSKGLNSLQLCSRRLLVNRIIINTAAIFLIAYFCDVIIILLSLVVPLHRQYLRLEKVVNLKHCGCHVLLSNMIFLFQIIFCQTVHSNLSVKYFYV